VSGSAIIKKACGGMEMVCEPDWRIDYMSKWNRAFRLLHRKGF